MAELLQELRLAWRALRAAPVTTGASIVVLALGTGVNLAVFAVAYGSLLRPLPYEEPSRLALVSLETGDGADFGFGAERADEWRRRLRSAEAVAAYAVGEDTLRGAGEPRLLTVAWVTEDFFGVLDGPVSAGRLGDFRADPGALVLSARAARQLGGAGTLLGRPLTLGSRPVTPIAVVPPEAGFPAAGIDAWVRADRVPADAGGADTRSFRLLARLLPGVSADRAREDALRVFHDLAGSTGPGDGSAPATHARPTVVPLSEAVAGGSRPVLAAAAGAALLVLLVTCGNVAMLLVGRAVLRRRESAIRLSLGASGGRLVCAALAESLLLAAAGALAGLGLAAAGLRVFAGVVGEGGAAGLSARLSAPLSGRILVFDTPVLAAAAGLVFLVAILAGTAPALQALGGRGAELATTLRTEGRSGSAGRGTRRLLAGLVAAQIAASVVLLAGAALLARTVERLMEQGEGFEPERVVVVRLAESLDDGEVAAVLARVRALPGVEAAGLGSAVPPADSPFRIHVRRIAAGVDEGLSLSLLTATPGYLDSLGIAPVAGRLLTAEDERFRAPVVLLSESAARHWFAEAPSAPGGPPGAPPAARVIGRELPGALPPVARFGGVAPRVVGVVEDAAFAGLDQPPEAALYLPWYAGWAPTAHVVVRSRGPAGEAGRLADAVRRAVREAAPSVPIPSVTTLEAEMAASIGDHRLRAVPAIGFAAVALGVALTGVGALFHRAAAERRHEMAVRMALGASGGRVVRLVLRGAGAVTGAGLAAGLAASVLLGAGLRGLLFGIGPHDPVTLAGVALAVAAACLFAAWLPARRAARVEPAELLRSD